MSYEKTNWVDRTPTNSGTPVNAANMNKIEEGIEDVAGAIIAFRDEFSRGATIKIAASNATEKSKAAADYVCTGENDEVIINAAIQELDGIGGCVELSEGDFFLGDSISLRNINNVWLRGQGRATLLACVGDVLSNVVYQHQDSSYCIISDLSVTNDAYGDALTINGYNNTIKNVYVERSTQRGMTVSGDNSMIHNCFIQGCSGSGIILYCIRTTVTNNWIVQTGGGGITDNGMYNIIEDNQVK